MKVVLISSHMRRFNLISKKKRVFRVKSSSFNYIYIFILVKANKTRRIARERELRVILIGSCKHLSVSCTYLILIWALGNILRCAVSSAFASFPSASHFRLQSKFMFGNVNNPSARNLQYCCMCMNYFTPSLAFRIFACIYFFPLNIHICQTRFLA